MARPHRPGSSIIHRKQETKYSTLKKKNAAWDQVWTGLWHRSPSLDLSLL